MCVHVYGMREHIFFIRFVRPMARLLFDVSSLVSMMRRTDLPFYRPADILAKMRQRNPTERQWNNKNKKNKVEEEAERMNERAEEMKIAGFLVPFIYYYGREGTNGSRHSK